MFNIDRHIGVSAGWIAGPAFAVAMMAAPEYFHLSPTASAWLFWGGIAVFLATIAVLAFISSREKGKQRTVTGPLILMLIGALTFCGGAALYFWPNKSEEASEGPPLDGAIQISCDPAEYPTILPQNKMYELQLNHRFMAATEGGAFISWSLPAGTPITTRDPKTFPTHGWRFRITNFGKIAVINATVTFNIEYRKGEEVLKRATATILPLFSLAPGDFVDVYAMNYSTEAVAVVTLPPTAQGFEPGGQKPETFKLIAPFLNGASIGPFNPPASPPAPPPPVPSPPSKQGKK